MALSTKSSLPIVLIVVMLLVTQHVNSQSPPPPGPRCKAGCFLRCIALILSPTYIPCVAACFVGICGTQIKALSQPLLQCGAGCVRSKCSNSGAVNGNVNAECVSSCVGECDSSFVGDLY